MSEANSYQVGGDHYNSAYKHWDMILDTGAGYLEAQATKYLTRWRKKEGVRDLDKAYHYVRKLQERADKAAMARGHPSAAIIAERLDLFFTTNEIPEPEQHIFRLLIGWTDSFQLEDAAVAIATLTAAAKAEPKPVPLEDSNKHAERA